MLRIGLTQRVEILPPGDERRDALDQAWTPLLLQNGCWPVPLPNKVDRVAALVRELRLDGIILTGGNDISMLPGATNTAPERDAFERTLLSMSAETDLPVLGVCRGLQMMVVHYGGTLVQLPDHVANSHAISIRSEGALPLPEQLIVNSFHHYGVREATLGPDLEIVATAPDGSVEAIRHKRFRQWGIMWHPERQPHGPHHGALLQHLFAGVKS